MEDPTYEREVARHLRRNIVVNFLDGTFFWFGYSFMAPAVILPVFVSHLTDNKIAIGLVSTLLAIGYCLPQLFTANWVSHLPVKKVVVVNLGLWTERLPILLLPFIVLLAPVSKDLCLVLFLLVYAWHSFGAGLVAVSWQDMLAKIIPQDKRGRFLGATNFGGTATGVLGAVIAAWLLGRFNYPTGYVISFSLAAFFIMASWVSLAQTREVPLQHKAEKTSQSQFWSSIPAILKGDPNLRNYILAQMLIGLGGLAAGFVSVYIVKRWNVSDGVIGGYTAWMLIGQAAANAVLGPLADRKGYKLVIFLGLAISTASYLIPILASNPGWFPFFFALRGISAAAGMLSFMIIFEFCKPEMRPTYLGLTNTLFGITSGVAPLLGGWLAGSLGYSGIFPIGLAISLIGLLMFALLVKEPRGLN